MFSTPGLLFLALFGLAGLGSAWLTGRVTEFLRRRAILDHPNDRSSHQIPTPRGGGWGILGVVLPLWAGLGVWTGAEGTTLVLLVALLLLAVVSWADDRFGLSAAPRFLAQIVAASVGVALLDPAASLIGPLLGPDGGGPSGWWPCGGWWLERGFLVLSWVWFINLFNFMDGIDGIAGGEAVSVAGGLVLVALVTGLPFLPAAQAAVIAGAALGFLRWNWHPARVFLGDVGSVPLGYALGWLLLSAALAGAWAAALLLPLYFLVDATVTLLRRALAGKKIWEAHREHFYQRAVQRGRTHAQVSRAVLLANAGLIGLALLVPVLGWSSVVGGAAVVAGVMGWMVL